MMIETNQCQITENQIESNVIGESVEILIVVNVVSINLPPKRYVLVCDRNGQPELCRGIMDENGDIHSVVLNKVKEETGFDIKHLVELITLGSIFPSPKTCDANEVFLYAWSTNITQQEFKEKQYRMFNNSSEKEIKLSFVEMQEMNKVLYRISDATTECAFRRFMS